MCTCGNIKELSYFTPGNETTYFFSSLILIFQPNDLLLVDVSAIGLMRANSAHPNQTTSYSVAYDLSLHLT